MGYLEVKRMEKNITTEEKKIERFVKKSIADRRERKYQINLTPDFADDRSIEFTQGEADDIMEELENKPEKKFSISLPFEYVEILDDIKKRDSKRWKMLKCTRNGIIREAIRKYIMDRGYIVTQEALGFQEVTELMPLLALSKKFKKLSDFPPWVRGHWARADQINTSHAEYIGDDSEEDVNKWFRETFEEIRKEKMGLNEFKKKETVGKLDC